MIDSVYEEAVEVINPEPAHTDNIAVDEDGLIHFPNGVILKYQPVSKLLLLDAMKKLKEPEVPTYFDEERKRDVENPADPAYKKARDDYNTRVFMVLNDVCVALGTVLHHRPPTVVDPNTDEWIDAVEYLTDLKIPRHVPQARHLAWVKYHVAVGETNFGMLARLVEEQMGVTDSQVNAAMTSFPDTEARDPTT